MPMNSSLIIECSTPRGSVALVGADGSIGQREFHSDRNHNALLFEPLQELLSSRPSLDRVLVGTGPGSYSGTRVGIAAAQGIGLALDCPVIGLPSILAVPCAGGGANCLAMGDARRGSFWICGIDQLRLASPPQLVDATALAEAVAEALTGGSPVFSFEDAGRFPIPDGIQSRIRLEHPDATRLWQAWQAADIVQQTAWQAQPAQPIYLKPPHITPGKSPRLIRD